jgi:hypothetical protein
VTEPAVQTPPAGDAAPPPRSRASAIGAAAFLLLSAPFLIFGGMMLALKARVELRCTPGGCALVHLSLLSQEEVERFTVQELQQAKVERNRSSRKGAEPVYRPVLETTRGRFPLSSRWLEEEQDAEHTVRILNRFIASPLSSGTVFHDHRRGPMIVGTSFSAMGGVLLGVSLWLALKARRQRRAERAARTMESSRA